MLQCHRDIVYHLKSTWLHSLHYLHASVLEAWEPHPFDKIFKTTFLLTIFLPFLYSS